MANEITVASRLTYEDNDDVSIEMEKLATTYSAGGEKAVKNRLAVTTSEVAIPLGSVTTLGWCAFRNLDPTNFIEIRVGTGGTKILKLKPGEQQVFRFGSGVTAPYAIADTGTCDMEYMITQG